MNDRDIELAEQAGGVRRLIMGMRHETFLTDEQIEAFAALIRAEEREVCLTLCKENFYAHQAYEDIRARGNT